MQSKLLLNIWSKFCLKWKSLTVWQKVPLTKFSNTRKTAEWNYCKNPCTTLPSELHQVLHMYFNWAVLKGQFPREWVWLQLGGSCQVISQVGKHGLNDQPPWPSSSGVQHNGQTMATSSWSILILFELQITGHIGVIVKSSFSPPPPNPYFEGSRGIYKAMFDSFHDPPKLQRFACFSKHRYNQF